MKRPKSHSKRGVKALCVLAALLFLAAAPRQGDPRFVQASSLLDAGRYPEAFSAYQEIYQASPLREDRGAALFFMAGVSANYLQDHRRAIALYERFLNEFQDLPQAEKARYLKAMAFFADKEYKRAKDELSAFARSNPESGLSSTAAVFAEEAERRLSGETPEESGPPAGGIVRVRLASGAKKLVLSSPGGIRALGPDGSTRAAGSIIAFTCAGQGIAADGRRLSLARLRVLSPSGRISLDGKAYRGEFLLSCAGNGMAAVNRVDVESYLYGVVPKEMPASWPAEALKAQAVAARTYALYAVARRKDADFDLSADTGSQVYGGLSAERPESSRAVDATRGRTLRSQGNLAMAYFHSDSAGYTEDAEAVWGTRIPYLTGRADPYTADLPSGAFRLALSYAELTAALGREAPGRVTDLSPGPATPSGRLGSVLVTGSGGKTSIKANRFRMLIGPSRLRSTRFSIEKTGDGVVLSGAGYGHGVGMSQYGARAMAKKGLGYEDILSFYFKGTELGQGS